MNRSIAAIAVLVFCALSLSAETFSTYKNWGDSPEAYFLTADERQQWAGITSDAQAETFVNEFRARRGGETFTKELKKRVDNADKYLTIGTAKGSTTLRGKTVILFGAPLNIGVNDRVAKGGFVPAGSSAAVTDLGGGVSSRGGDGESQKMGSSVPGRSFRDFTFTFAAKDNPGFRGKDYVITIEADTATGKDKVGKGVKQKDLDALFEAAAAASIKTAR